MKPNRVISIQEMIATVQPSMTIKLTQFSDRCIKIEVSCPRKIYPKIYQITIGEIFKGLQRTQHLIQKYQHRKIVVSRQFFEYYRKWFATIQFQEVFILQEFSQQQISIILACKPRKIAFNFHIQISKIRQIQKLAKKQSQLRLISYEFHLSDATQWSQIVSFIKNWIEDQTKSQLIFEKISLIDRHNEVLCSLEKQQNYGFFVSVTNMDIGSDNVLKILKIIALFEHKVSIEFCFWHSYFIEAISFIMTNFTPQENYLVKFANYVEITNYQFSLNTAQMKCNEVRQIIEILKQPGHYQLIFHSSKKYLEQIIFLFLEKPIIKFRYFVLYPEFDDIREPIQVMENQAENLRERISIFMSMLDHPAKIDFDLGLKLYQALPRSKQ